MAALIIAKGIGVMPAKQLKHLTPIAQMHFGDATRPRLSIGDHALAIGVEVVMGVGSA